MTGVLLAVRSHRARHRMERITGKVPEFFVWGKPTHYFEVPAELVDAVLRIPGISRCRPPGPLCRTWGTSET